MVPLRRSPRGGGEGQIVTSRIDRERAAVVTTRAELAAAVHRVFNRVRHHLAAEVARLVDAAREAAMKAAPKLPDDLDIQAIVDAILDEVDLRGLTILADDAETILATIVKDGGAAGLEQLEAGAGVDVEQINDAAVEWARDRAAELVGMRRTADDELVANPDAIWAITDSTREMLRGDVTRAIEEGTSTTDFAAALEESYAFSAERAETIARTEIARADVAGNMIAYRESGVVIGKAWLLGSEHDDDDECDDAAAMGVVDLDDDFGGIGDPPAHPNCVCDVAPVVDSGDA
jgi:hypothetical protein